MPSFIDSSGLIRVTDGAVRPGTTRPELAHLSSCVYSVDTQTRKSRMQGVVKKWGNSAAVRIPTSVLEAAQVRLNQPVEVREEGGRIVIEPMHPVRYSIEALVAGITDENLHRSIDMGKSVGEETW